MVAALLRTAHPNVVFVETADECAVCQKYHASYLTVLVTDLSSSRWTLLGMILVDDARLGQLWSFRTGHTN